MVNEIHKLTQFGVVSLSFICTVSRVGYKEVLIRFAELIPEVIQ